MSSIVIHGGIIKFEGAHTGAKEYRVELERIVKAASAVLNNSNAREAVLYAIRALENCPLFNAGTGSRIQADGEIRMSAALMDGNANRFSGIINVQYVKNPIDLAALLAEEQFKVLAGPEATRYARAQGVLSHSPYTKHRLQEFQKKAFGRSGTVGAVAVDKDGAIYAATSTGGVGGETPGRVSDSATVAGNYATGRVGVSCTGVGEEIVNHATAARVAVRVEDGMALREAVAKTIGEARARGYTFGLIALDRDGEVVVDQTAGRVLFGYFRDGDVVVFHP